MPSNRKKAIQELTRQLSCLQEQLSAEQDELNSRKKQFMLLDSVAQAMRAMLIARAEVQGIDEEDWFQEPIIDGTCLVADTDNSASDDQATNSAAGCQRDGSVEKVCSEPHQERLGDLDSPLSYMSAFCKAGPAPGTDTITLAELRLVYANIIKNGIAQLQLLAKPFKQNLGQHDPRQQLVNWVKDYLHLWTSLLVQGRGSVMYELALSNCLTGEKVEQHDVQPYQFAIGYLGLSQEQKQQIIEAVPIFKRLQQLVLDELQQVQQQKLQHASDASTADGSVHLPLGMLSQPSSKDLQRIEHEERAAKLNMLLRKQHLLGACYNGYILGCLTYEQVVRFGVLLYPFHPFAYLLADAIVAEQNSR